MDRLRRDGAVLGRTSGGLPRAGLAIKAEGKTVSALYLIKVKRRAGMRPSKIHEATAALRPVCGGGNGGKSIGAWQQDIGPDNCKRCAKLKEMAALKLTKTTEKEPT